MRRNMDKRHLVKHSVDAMYVAEMHVEQMKMKVSGDLYPACQTFPWSNTYSNFDTWAADEGAWTNAI